MLWDVPDQLERAAAPVFARLGRTRARRERWLVPPEAAAEAELQALAAELGAQVVAFREPLERRAQELGQRLAEWRPLRTLLLLPSLAAPGQVGLRTRSDLASLVVLTKLWRSGGRRIYLCNVAAPGQAYRWAGYFEDRLLASGWDLLSGSEPLFSVAALGPRASSLWRKRTGRERPLIVHSVCSMDLGGTQRQVAFFLDPELTQACDHVVLSSRSENDFWEGARPVTQPRAGAATLGQRLVARLQRVVGGRSLPEQAFTMDMPRLALALAELQPDLVVGWGHEQATTAHYAANLAGAPAFVYAIRALTEGIAMQGRDRALLGLHRRTRYRRSATVCNSQAARADYARWVGLEEGAIHVIPNGLGPAPEIDPAARDRLRHELGVAADTPLVISVGRLSREKGHALLVEALGALPGIELVLVGDGPEEPRLRALAAEHAPGRAHFVGRQRDVPAWLSAGDLFCLPSFNEGMPNALMEAMQLGLPSVATARGGSLDLIRSRVDGLLCEATSAALAASLGQLASDPPAARAMGQAARQRIAEEFSAANMVARYETVFLQSLGRTPRRGAAVYSAR